MSAVGVWGRWHGAKEYGSRTDKKTMTGCGVIAGQGEAGPLDQNKIMHEQMLNRLSSHPTSQTACSPTLGHSVPMLGPR